MKNRLWAAVVLLSVVIAVLSLLGPGADDSGVTLAELTSVGQNDTRWVGDYFNFDQPSATAISLAGLEIESIFYGVLGLCGFVLALRVFISALRMLKEERVLAKRKSLETSTDVVQRAQRYSEKVDTPAVVRAVAQSDFDDSGTENPAIFADHAGSRPPNRSFPLYSRGLTGRMILTFSGIVAVFGLGIVALVYFTLTSSLNKHIIERSKVTALNVSDGAPVYLFKNDAAGLRELLRKQANRPELAYIMVENRAGEIFAHSFAILPEEIRDRASSGGTGVDMHRSFRLGAAGVDEVAIPIMEGRAGKVRLGIWRDQVQAQIHETVMPLVKLLLVLVAGAIVMAAFLAWRINRPIHKLVAAAKAISAGNLDTPSVRIEGTTEISELARALERMRSSVKAAMIRLGR